MSETQQTIQKIRDKIERIDEMLVFDVDIPPETCIGMLKVQALLEAELERQEAKIK